jgi:hypothetical protein
MDSTHSYQPSQLSVACSTFQCESHGSEAQAPSSKLQAPSSKLRASHTSHAVTAQTGSAGLCTSYRMVPPGQKNVRFDGGQIYFRAIFFSRPRSPNGKKLEMILRCSGAPAHFPTLDPETDPRTSMHVLAVPGQHGASNIQPWSSAREERACGLQLTCNGSATELGAFHDGREGMHGPCG